MHRRFRLARRIVAFISIIIFLPPTPFFTLFPDPIGHFESHFGILRFSKKEQDLVFSVKLQPFL